MDFLYTEISILPSNLYSVNKEFTMKIALSKNQKEPAKRLTTLRPVLFFQN
jgi:hypothetical protein